MPYWVALVGRAGTAVTRAAQPDRGKGTDQPSEFLGRDNWGALQTKAIRSCPGRNDQVREDRPLEGRGSVELAGNTSPAVRSAVVSRTHCDRGESLRPSLSASLVGAGLLQRDQLALEVGLQMGVMVTLEGAQLFDLFLQHSSFAVELLK